MLESLKQVTNEMNQPKNINTLFPTEKFIYLASPTRILDNSYYILCLILQLGLYVL